jgi:hypothetical protein
MIKTTLLAGLACTIGCAIGFTAPAQALYLPWDAGVGGAIGGYKIVGSSRADDAPLLALTLDRNAHVTGRYDRAVVKFDRVIRADGTAMLMRRVSHPNYPNVFAYLPKSWPGTGAWGVERVHAADGHVIATRDVIIPQFEIERQPIPMNGPQVGTIVASRDIMSDGSTQLALGVRESEPGVAVALLGAMGEGRTGGNLETERKQREEQESVKRGMLLQKASG